MKAEGITLEKIGELLGGISRQRVHQIINGNIKYFKDEGQKAEYNRHMQHQWTGYNPRKDCRYCGFVSEKTRRRLEKQNAKKD